MKQSIIKTIFLLTLFGGFFSCETSKEQNPTVDSQTRTDVPQPDIRYAINSLDSQENIQIQGPARIIQRNGRSGINTTSIRSRVKLSKHGINRNKGTVSLWVMSLEDIAPAWTASYVRTDYEYVNIFPLLVDQEELGDFASANFSFHIKKMWHPGLTIKFKQGTGHDMYNHAAAAANHSDFEKLRWYYLTATWDLEQKSIALYMNGIKVGSHDVTAERLERDVCGDTLYFGNPTLCVSDIQFYDEALSSDEVYTIYREEATDYDADFEKELRHIYTGADVKDFDFKPDSKWEEKLSLDMTKPADLDSFYVQGYTQAVQSTPEGILVETPNVPIGVGQYEKQVYLWTKKPFEGDLYVEYDFKPMRKGGLSLIMIQASGMQREDFMADYPLRTAGNMGMVAWSSIRNYHWEYYREMNDVRNDLANGAMLKNPYQYPLGYGTLNHPLAQNEWHKLQILQIGNKIVGAIDGKIIIEAEDNGFINNGAVYNFGRVAIRCMVRSKILFRNLKVYNRNEYFEVVEE